MTRVVGGEGSEKKSPNVTKGYQGGPGEAREKFGAFYSKKHKDLLSEIAFIFRVDL